MILSASILGAVSTLEVAAAACVGLFGLVLLLVFARFFRLWLAAFMSRANVRMQDLIEMRLRQVDFGAVARAKIQLAKAGVSDVTLQDIERHYSAGGRVKDVALAVARARQASLDLDWQAACVIDMSGRDVLLEVDDAVRRAAEKLAVGEKRA